MRTCDQRVGQTYHKVFQCPATWVQYEPAVLEAFYDIRVLVQETFDQITIGDVCRVAHPATR